VKIGGNETGINEEKSGLDRGRVEWINGASMGGRRTSRSVGSVKKEATPKHLGADLSEELKERSGKGGTGTFCQKGLQLNGMTSRGITLASAGIYGCGEGAGNRKE